VISVTAHERAPVFASMLIEILNAVRHKGISRQAVTERASSATPGTAPFLHSLAGPPLPLLTVVDDCTRECLALVADTSLSGVRVARELDRLMIERGKPKMVVSDNGSELTSNASDLG
jgi:putative transposase